MSTKSPAKELATPIEPMSDGIDKAASQETHKKPRARREVYTLGTRVLERAFDKQAPEHYYTWRTDVMDNEEAGSESDNVRLRDLEEMRDRMESLAKGYILDFLQDYSGELDLPAISGRLEAARLLFIAQSDANPLVARRLEGHYSPDSRVAKVFTYDEEEKANLGSTIHELLHSASSVMYSTTPALLKAGGHEAVLGGLRRAEHFKWLDEAVTETLSRTITENNDVDEPLMHSYDYEVSLLKEMIKVSGVPLSKFVEAYFEEVDLDAEPGQRMPRWHALQSALNGRFGPHFIEKIEQELEKNPKGFGGDTLLKKDDAGRSGIELMFENWRDRNKQ